MTSPFVTIDWLSEHLGEPGVPVVDASWYLPQMHRDAHAEYLESHIPGAVFFDIDGIADTASELPHMLPAPDVFAEVVGKLGISDRDTIVVYDGMGLFSAARVWWSFKVMGAREVYILDGGLPAWLEGGHPVESGPVRTEPATFTPHPRDAAVQDAKDVSTALASGKQVVDVRPHQRFTGEAAEPRPGLRSGHMPGALNIPFGDLVTHGRMRPADELQTLFAQHGFAPDKPFVSSCGSGVTAPLLNLAAAVLGYEALDVYDGSWAEWGGNPDLPVVRETG